MATLDFSDVILSPEFMSGFSVIRRTEAVGGTGRSATTTEQTDNLLGIITFGSGGTRREPEAQSASRTMNIITQFSLREASDGIQPDVILFNGVRYTVIKVDPWQHVGSGFVSAQATIQSASVPPSV